MSAADSVATPYPLVVKRCGPSLHADKTLVLLRRMYPGSHTLAINIANRVLALTEPEAHEELSKVIDLFGNRHHMVLETFLQRFREVRGNTKQDWQVTDTRAALIGSYFMQEYSIESAALFNPSIVPHPDQTDVPAGSMRFVMSLRATGEGHISSVTFREGIVNSHQRVSLENLPLVIVESRRVQNILFDKSEFVRKAKERIPAALFAEKFCTDLIDALPSSFVLDELRQICSKQHRTSPGLIADNVCNGFLVLAESEYEVEFPCESTISERVLFPSAPSQSHGIEDARFVHFTHPDGTKVYYATYTAYDGRIALPQIMETNDFTSFKFTNLSGAIQNKGFALFPRLINGKYWMLSRQDDENVLIMSSDSLYQWENPQVLLRPAFPWESFKIGNCGSPVETPKGWLVLTHGVGPMRRYSIGLAMLDLNDPTKVLARIPEPLLEPNELEREGYVPNVCYTCGFFIHEDVVVVPYAMSDSESSFATVSLKNIYKVMGL